MVKVVGRTLAGRLRYVRRYHGEEVLQGVLADLDDQETAQLLRSGVDADQWYPLEIFIGLSMAIDRVCGAGDGALYGQLAGQVAEDDLSTVLKMFFRIATPGFILGKAAQVWRRYYDSGDLDVVYFKPGREEIVQIEIIDFATPHPVHCASVAGWLLRCAQLTGCKNVQARQLCCRATGDTRCIIDLRWSGLARS